MFGLLKRRVIHPLIRWYKGRNTGDLTSKVVILQQPETQTLSTEEKLDSDIRLTFDQNILKFLMYTSPLAEHMPPSDLGTNRGIEKARQFALANPEKVLPVLIDSISSQGKVSNDAEKYVLTRELVGNPMDTLQNALANYTNLAKAKGSSNEDIKCVKKQACNLFMQQAADYGLLEAVQAEITLRKQGNYIGSTRNSTQAQKPSSEDWQIITSSAASTMPVTVGTHRQSATGWKPATPSSPTHKERREDHKLRHSVEQVMGAKVLTEERRQNLRTGMHRSNAPAHPSGQKELAAV